MKGRTPGAYDLPDQTKRTRKLLKGKKAETKLLGSVKSPPPEERRSVSKNRNTAKSHGLNLSSVKQNTQETLVKRKKKKPIISATENSKANLIIKKALEVLKREEKERKKSEERESKDKIERINKSKMYANLVRQKNEKQTKHTTHVVQPTSQPPCPWGADQRKLNFKRNFSEKHLNLRGVALADNNDANSTHRRHSASKERKSSTTTGLHLADAARRVAGQADKKDSNEVARKKDDLSMKVKKPKVEKKSKATIEEELPAKASTFNFGATMGTMSSSAGFKPRMTVSKPRSLHSLVADIKASQQATRLRDKALALLGDRMRVHISKLQASSLSTAKRSKSKEKGLMTDENKQRRVKKVKRPRKKERNVGKIQISKRETGQEQHHQEERLDMLAKHPGERKVSSSASSDQESDRSEKRYYIEEVSHISEKMDFLHNAASSIQKVWRGFASRKHQDETEDGRLLLDRGLKKADKSSSSKKQGSVKEEVSVKPKNFEIQYSEIKSERSGIEVVWPKVD